MAAGPEVFVRLFSKMCSYGEKRSRERGQCLKCSICVLTDGKGEGEGREHRQAQGQGFMPLPALGVGGRMRPWKGRTSSGKADNYQGKAGQHFHRCTVVLPGKRELGWSRVGFPAHVREEI